MKNLIDAGLSSGSSAHMPNETGTAKVQKTIRLPDQLIRAVEATLAIKRPKERNFSEASEAALRDWLKRNGGQRLLS